jgi:ATP/maltotriose-dependent transcriptional regulator MalT
MSAALAQALRNGPTPVDEAIQRCEEILAIGLVDQQAEAMTTLHLAYLRALAGDLLTARTLCGEARRRLSDLGGGMVAVRSSLVTGRVELLAGDAERAEAELRRDYDALGEMGERYFRPLIGALLAQAVYSAGRHHEALVLTARVEETASSDDVETQALWRCVRAKGVAERGYVEEADRLSRRAVKILEPSDALVMKGDTFRDQAQVLLQVGRGDEALVALRQARELYLAKGASLPLSRIDSLLLSLDGDVRPTSRVPCS